MRRLLLACLVILGFAGNVQAQGTATTFTFTPPVTGGVGGTCNMAAPTTFFVTVQSFGPAGFVLIYLLDGANRVISPAGTVPVPAGPGPAALPASDAPVTGPFHWVATNNFTPNPLGTPFIGPALAGSLPFDANALNSNCPPPLVPNLAPIPTLGRFGIALLALLLAAAGLVFQRRSRVL